MLLTITLAALVLTIATAAALGSIASTFAATSARRRRLAPRAGQPPVSVLKPLAGADDALEANLASFFAQTYPDFELVFGVLKADDPAVPVVQRLMARHPRVRARLVVADGPLRALNLKVANLRSMLGAGAHDLVLISDSNIAVEPDYLSRMVGHLVTGERVGLVTSLFAGTGERTFGATLENLHLNGLVAGSVAASQELGGKTAAIGKSMLFSQATFERLGGFESVATLLAEDAVMGRMFQEAGYEVRLSDGVIQNVNANNTFRGFLARHVRWALIRSRLDALLYLAEPLASPLAAGLLAAPLVGSLWPVLFGAALTMARDGLQWLRLRGKAGLLAALPLSPLKELLLLGVWAVAPFLRRVSWRGQSYRVTRGTRLLADRA